MNWLGVVGSWVFRVKAPRNSYPALDKTDREIRTLELRQRRILGFLDEELKLLRLDQHNKGSST